MLMNKSVYLGHTILVISKIVLCEFQYDYVKPKYVQKAKLCYILLNGVTFKQIFKTRFDTTDYELNRPLPRRKNKTIIEFMKDEL